MQQVYAGWTQTWHCGLYQQYSADKITSNKLMYRGKCQRQLHITAVSNNVHCDS